MIIDIDQSGKLEQLDTGTAVAFSNGKSSAVWLSVPTKRRIVAFLRQTLIPSFDAWAVVFAIVIFILIEKLPPDIVLRVDEEYTGKEEVIAEVLKKLLQKKFADRWRGSIRFAQVGKSSGAHKLSWLVHRQKNQQRVRTLTDKEILRFLQ